MAKLAAILENVKKLCKKCDWVFLVVTENEIACRIYTAEYNIDQTVNR